MTPQAKVRLGWLCALLLLATIGVGVCLHLTSTKRNRPRVFCQGAPCDGTGPEGKPARVGGLRAQARPGNRSGVLREVPGETGRAQDCAVAGAGIADRTTTPRDPGSRRPRRAPQAGVRGVSPALFARPLRGGQRQMTVAAASAMLPGLFVSPWKGACRWARLYGTRERGSGFRRGSTWRTRGA